jgi:hypothetical protein
MAEYAKVYGEDGFKMADGTHKITKYNMIFVFWMVIDCLLWSKFVGYTANFSENSDIILNGANVFFKCEALPSTVDADANKILVGGIPGFFDPFLDNEIDLDADSTPASKRHEIGTSLSKTGFMSNEGSSFPSVAEHFGWTHLLYCRHFATQILTAWHGIADPKQLQSDVYKILDTPCLGGLLLLLKQAFTKYLTKKA